jgi:isoamylase
VRATSDSILTEGPTAVVPYRYRDHVRMVTRGYRLSPGAHATAGSVNFVVISRHATAARLILSEPCNGEIYAKIPLIPQLNRTGDHWHIQVAGLPEEFCYGYRVDGPIGPGHHFDFTKVLLDPSKRRRPFEAATGH